MSTGTTTRGQIALHYDRIKRRVDNVRLRDGLQMELVSVAKTVLEMYPIEAASTSSAMPDPDDVTELMQSLLPSPGHVFDDSFFRAPLFAVVTLFKVADLYGCVIPQDPLYAHLELDEEDRNNKNIAAHVWFSDFLGCDRETILACVARYKQFRGSPDSLRRLSLAPPANDIRTEPDHPSENDQEVVAEAPRRPDSGSGSVIRDEEVPLRNPQRRESGQRSALLGRNEVENDASESKKATNVFYYFKDSKFTGDLSQSIDMTLRDYNVCARQHRLNARQKADFFINVLAGPARTFFFNNARDDMNFEEMAIMMAREYNSDSRQLQVQGMLETLRLDKHMSEHDISSYSEGLTQIIDLIERLTPQCQPQFRSDANKINYLRKAVMGLSWAMTPIGNIITAKYTFNGFVTALREHLQLENELRVSGNSTKAPYFTQDGIYHQQYGRRPKSVQKHGTPGGSGSCSRPSETSSFAESRRKGICHRCRQKWKPGHRCQPGSIRNYVRDRFKNGDAAVHIMSDLVLGMEGELEDDVIQDSEDGSEDARSDEVHYSGTQDELAAFDKLLNAEDSTGTHFLEQSDKEWFTNHISASFATDQDCAPNPPSGFVAGDDQ